MQLTKNNKMFFLKRFSKKVEYALFRVFVAPKMLHCGLKTFIQKPFRIDGCKFISLGDFSVIQGNVWLYCESVDDVSANLFIGNNCTLGYNNHITAVREVVIEDDVLTANNVYISDNLHEYMDIHVPIVRQPVSFKGSVRIGRGTWLGENVCVIGATIGRNCVIGANAVVTHDVPDYSVVVGVPGRVIRQYDHQQRCWVDK